MRGGGHSNYVADPTKQAAFFRQMAERNEVEPVELLSYFPAEWIHAVDNYQRMVGKMALSQIIAEPFPKSKHPDNEELQHIASNNTSMYEDGVEDQIYTDEILSALLQERDRHKGDEAYSRLVRTRRTLLAYMVFSAIEDHSAA